MTYRSFHLPGIAGLAVTTVLSLPIAQAHAQKSYPTPDQAANALVDAVKEGTSRAMLKVLGPRAQDIIESGDDVADVETRKKFLLAYDAKHLIRSGDNKTGTLIVGTDDFPFPIPLVHQHSGWEFDAKAGRREILYRRIGRNELDAIQTCLAYVDAQNEYAEKDRTGAGAGVYAQRIVSSPGKKDGLYWQDDRDQSPLGELAAQASAEGYRISAGPAPYHGYYYHILKGQGEDAPGGPHYYVVWGKMIGGFALVAYPAEYGNSGVMTFLVNHAGTVYQKDLGPRTDIIAKRMTLFDPDHTWKKVDTGQ
jgi:Protein of unknown function (DUF2950)